MAQYKVIQDVEAEDKLLGPLTLRQFIYAGITAIMLYLSYFAATHHATFLVVIFFPIAAVTGFFAFPWGRDQPTEIWALAKVRFLIKPRRRIWDQSGAKELVSITAPKKMHVDYTNGLSENEVRSRLHALADTIDSRGWAIKNANLNMYAQPALVMAEPTSDRLVNASALPHEVSDIDVLASDDILDEKNNARAQAVDNMIEASAKAHREQIMENLRQNAQAAPEPQAAKPQPPQNQQGQGGQQGSGNPGDPNYRSNDYWFLNQPSRSANIPANMVTFNTQVVTPGMNAAPSTPVPAPVPLPSANDEQNLVQALEAKRQEIPTTAYYSHLHTIQPLSAQPQQAPQQQPMQMPTGSNNGQAPVPRPAATMGMGSFMPPLPSEGPLMGAPTPLAGVQQNAQSMPPLPTMPASPMPSGGIAQAVANGMPLPQQQQFSIARPQPQQPAQPPVTPAQQAAILQLANNNDLNVATLAREADRAASDEVVIKLH
jgi:hypothetical protein